MIAFVEGRRCIRNIQRFIGAGVVEGHDERARHRERAVEKLGGGIRRCDAQRAGRCGRSGQRDGVIHLALVHGVGVGRPGLEVGDAPVHRHRAVHAKAAADHRGGGVLYIGRVAVQCGLIAGGNGHACARAGAHRHRVACGVDDRERPLAAGHDERGGRRQRTRQLQRLHLALVRGGV